MSEWMDHLLNDPIRDNPWALGFLIVLALAYAGPLLVMMGRDMFRRRRKQETTMTDETTGGNQWPQDHATDVTYDNPETDDPQTEVRRAAMESDPAQAQPLTPLAVFTDPAEVDAATEERWRAEGIDTTTRMPAPVQYGYAPVPKALVPATRTACEHCSGRGYVPGINDMLNESLALLGDQGDAVIRAFYSRLFMVDPGLASLFPGNPTEGDLGTDHKGTAQREKLLNAIAALADLYDPGDAEKMERLDGALQRFGRTHAAFTRPDGTIKGATLEEYAAVKDALFTTLVRTAAEAWRAEYTEAWSEAYDYAAGVMIAEQKRSGFTAPRFARQG